MSIVVSVLFPDYNGTYITESINESTTSQWPLCRFSVMYHITVARIYQRYQRYLSGLYILSSVIFRS